MDSFADVVRQGLGGQRKVLPCRFLYDQAGSEFFEAICALPEYYLTRAESAILQAQSEVIAAVVAPGSALVELGSGSAVKTRLLIAAFLKRQQILHYLPIDISPSILEESILALGRDYPGLRVSGVVGEYAEGLDYLGEHLEEPKLILWLGSNVGNFERPAAARFLRQVRGGMGPGDRLLMGVDLRKDKAILERAYDDRQGVTAAFNLNLLVRVNRELGGHFDLSKFRHQAVYDEKEGRISMYLVSRQAQRVAIDGLAMEVVFAAEEAIHTEDSYKYAPEEIDDLAQRAGFTVEERFFDEEKCFSDNLLAVDGPGA